MIRIVMLVFLVLSSTSAQAVPPPNSGAVFTPNQTSASLLIRYAERIKEQAGPSAMAEADKKYLLLYDVYLKARSYTLLNKLFFWLSVVSGLSVLLWPSLTVIFKDKLNRWEWIKSATVQTTVTGIAALMFTFYAQYKDKQTYAETLMRHIVYSEASVSALAVQVAEELARIDRGFSFNSILGGESGKSGEEPR